MRHVRQDYGHTWREHVRKGPPLLLCHDIVEEGHLSEEQASWRTCIHNAGLLLSKARASNWRVAHAFKSDVTPQPIQTVRPLPEEPVFRCKGPSAFTSDGLCSLIGAVTPSQILLVGRSLLPMCLASAAICADLQLPLSIVSDGISIAKPAQSDIRDTRDMDVAHLLPLFANLTTTAQVLKLASSIALVSFKELA